jgi:hypothetical protein
MSTAYCNIGCHSFSMYLYYGRAIAQAVSRWLPIAAARVRARVSQVGCGGQGGAGAGFLRVLRFPLPIFIPPNSPSSSQSAGAGTIGHSVADVPSGPSLDSTPNMRNKKKVCLFLLFSAYLECLELCMLFTCCYTRKLLFKNTNIKIALKTVIQYVTYLSNMLQYGHTKIYKLTCWNVKNHTRSTRGDR